MTYAQRTNYIQCKPHSHPHKRKMIYNKCRLNPQLYALLNSYFWKIVEPVWTPPSKEYGYGTQAHTSPIYLTMGLRIICPLQAHTMPLHWLATVYWLQRIYTVVCKGYHWNSINLSDNKRLKACFLISQNKIFYLKCN